MNVTRGLWRAWIFVTVLWVAGTAWSAYVRLPEWVAAQKYRYIEPLKELLSGPFDRRDWTKPYYDLILSPSKDHLTPEFTVLEYPYPANWDERVNAGKLRPVSFPDNSLLYLSTEMTKDDLNYVADAFWDQRWQRYWQVALPYVYGGAGPPIALLLIGSFLVWVGRGFARDEPRLG
jgi:hypothetical protein